jgi:ribosomal protein S18 acetylase RimI-like enzyme
VTTSAAQSAFLIRRALPADGAGTSHVLHVVAGERIHSAIDRAWSAEEQRAYIASLSNREVMHVATDPNGRIVACQALDLYSRALTSMDHVAQLGTFVLPEWRGRGVGRALFDQTRRFAVSAGYRKIVIQVRASNVSAQAFYRRVGFSDCGRLRAQVVIDGCEDDEILMEYFL